MMYLFLVFLSLAFVWVRAFPGSENPVMVVPKLVVPSTRSCTIQILTAACSGYYQVTQAPFKFPKNCDSPDDWAQIVLHLHGAVKGVQFDRYGAFWINGLEVLRLTTPEPTQAGITWDVEKDVSDLKTFFKANAHNLTSYLLIPNVVDSTYTGVIYANISLTFYLASPLVTTLGPLNSGPYLTQIQAAGETAFALTLVAAILSLVAAVSALQRFFQNTAFPKIIGASSAFISMVVSVAAFANWHVNGYLAFRDNAFGQVDSQFITSYEYYGFNVVVIGCIFSLVTFVFHISASSFTSFHKTPTTAAETALLSGALITSLLSTGLFLVGVTAWSTNYVNIINVAWSFFGLQPKVGNIVLGNAKAFLGLQGLVIASSRGGSSSFIAWSTLSSSDTGVEAIPDHQYFLPLTNAPIVSPGNPMGALTISGTQKQTYDFALSQIKDNIYVSDGLYAQIYATPHGCEEFYYSNVPNNASASLGICGGGAYREILVEIDGLFANSVIPFPVVYTGGINPYLWRPLSGIMSFNIPAYVLDLSPFLGLLADGKHHNISVSVLNNGDQGFWLVDVGLLIKESASGATHNLFQNTPANVIVNSTFDAYYDTGARVTVEELERIYKNESGKQIPLITFNTFASREFYVKSTFSTANKRNVSRSVHNVLSLNNTNNIIEGKTLYY